MNEVTQVAVDLPVIEPGMWFWAAPESTARDTAYYYERAIGDRWIDCWFYMDLNGKGCWNRTKMLPSDLDGLTACDPHQAADELYGLLGVSGKDSEQA